MKYLIVGLGNPGTEYQKTRHNIGFKVLDKIASLSKKSYSIDRYAYTCETTYRGRKLFLVKPNTFMNLSGKAVQYWIKKSKISRQNLLIITDDISLPFGVLRLRKKGSAGGHNGLSNIQFFLGDNSYNRLRFGIGNDFDRGKQAEFVLSNFTEEDCKTIDDRIDMAIKIIYSFTTNGVERTMSEMNGK